MRPLGRNLQRGNSRDFFGNVFNIATALAACCHAFRQRRARAPQSSLSLSLQFSQISLLCVHLAGSVKESEIAPSFRRVVNESRTCSSPMTGEELNSRLRLSHQRVIHLHRIEGAIHPLAEHINHIHT